jgi:hypothetical protein
MLAKSNTEPENDSCFFHDTGLKDEFIFGCCSNSSHLRLMQFYNLNIRYHYSLYMFDDDISLFQCTFDFFLLT